MNERLYAAYESLKKKNETAFLKNELELDHSWGKPTWGITFQIDLGKEERDMLEKIQKDLDMLEPENLLLLPRNYQHISFNQVVFWNGQYTEGKEKTWKKMEDKFLIALQTCDGSIKSFQITFRLLVGTTGGIIWCAYDEHDELQFLRESFFQKLPFPGETTKRNNIIHTTVARYKKPLNNPGKTLAYLEKFQNQVTMTVKSIYLRKELVFPSIKTEDIAHIDLL